MDWQKCNQTWEEFRREHEKFYELPRGLCFLDSTGKLYLVGDVNVLSGICDDCKFKFDDRSTHVVAWCKIEIPDRPANL